MKCATQGKTMFPTKKDVRTFVNANPHKNLREYYCEFCNTWHITHNPLLPPKAAAKTIDNNEFKKYIDE